MPADSSLSAEKAALRLKLKAARDAIPVSMRETYSAAIRARLLGLKAVQGARRVFIFISNGSEVDTHPLVQGFLAEGREVAVPKIVAKTEMIACRLRDWSGLKAAQLGILSPIATEPVAGHFDLVVTPGLGFTESGRRIGYGAGYYDRWFAAHSVANKIALAFEAQVLPAIPVDENDLPVDAIVTEKRVIAVRNGIDVQITE
ncbi:MAG: 5-formyltetrahydrofolate cyclo-ligase [Gammaproteobacteria bacterium]